LGITQFNSKGFPKFSNARDSAATSLKLSVLALIASKMACDELRELGVELGSLNETENSLLSI
jgi:hypothetical protein